MLKQDEQFIEKNKEDLSAAVQSTIIEILMDKLVKAAKLTNIKQVAIAGGVSANSGLREAITTTGKRLGWKTFIPPFKFTTDNAAMIASAGYFKFLDEDFASQDITPYARSKF